LAGVEATAMDDDDDGNDDEEEVEGEEDVVCCWMWVGMGVRTSNKRLWTVFPVGNIFYFGKIVKTGIIGPFYSTIT
jgi:hypothetical protein